MGQCFNQIYDGLENMIFPPQKMLRNQNTEPTPLHFSRLPNQRWALGCAVPAQLSRKYRRWMEKGSPEGASSC